MERKVGEIFEYEGHKLKVVEEVGTECHKCFLFSRDCKSSDIRGACWKNDRTDNKSVIFVEAKDEQLQELNLCEILKNCPKGEEFWSPLFGHVKLHKINHEAKKVVVISNIKMPLDINNDGTMLIYGVVSSEIMLFPSKEQRDWTKVKYEKKNEKFDPKTLKAFDRVLCRNGLDIWRCDFFSSYMETYVCPNVCISGSYSYCIPYNEETRHLVGTKDEAPDYYKYWED